MLPHACENRGEVAGPEDSPGEQESMANDNVYGTTRSWSQAQCEAECVWCGDGIVQAAQGEQCDNGDPNNKDPEAKVVQKRQGVQGAPGLVNIPSEIGSAEEILPGGWIVVSPEDVPAGAKTQVVDGKLHMLVEGEKKLGQAWMNQILNDASTCNASCTMTKCAEIKQNTGGDASKDPNSWMCLHMDTCSGWQGPVDAKGELTPSYNCPWMVGSDITGPAQGGVDLANPTLEEADAGDELQASLLSSDLAGNVNDPLRAQLLGDPNAGRGIARLAGKPLDTFLCKDWEELPPELFVMTEGDPCSLYYHVPKCAIPEHVGEYCYVTHREPYPGEITIFEKSKSPDPLISAPALEQVKEIGIGPCPPEEGGDLCVTFARCTYPTCGPDVDLPVGEIPAEHTGKPPMWCIRRVWHFEGATKMDDRKCVSPHPGPRNQNRLAGNDGRAPPPGGGGGGGAPGGDDGGGQPGGGPGGPTGGGLGGGGGSSRRSASGSVRSGSGGSRVSVSSARTSGSSRSSLRSSVRSSALSVSRISNSSSSKGQFVCPENACGVDNDSVPGPDGIAFCAKFNESCASIDDLPCIRCIPASSSASSRRSSASSSSKSGSAASDSSVRSGGGSSQGGGSSDRDGRSSARSEPPGGSSAKPTFCGNGIFNPGEECGEPGLSCSFGGTCTNCLCQVCGNGEIEGTEQCDDGNNASNDGCSAQCKVEKCGDKIVQAPLGEQCDNGSVCSGNSATSCVIDSECRTCKAVAGGSTKRCGGGAFGKLCGTDAECATETQLLCRYDERNERCDANCKTNASASSHASSARSSGGSSDDDGGSSRRSSGGSQSSRRSSTDSDGPDSSRRSSGGSSTNSDGPGSSRRSSQSSSANFCTTDLECLNCQRCSNNRCEQIPGCTLSSASSRSSSRFSSSSIRACFNNFDCGFCEICSNGACRNDPNCRNSSSSRRDCFNNFDCGTCEQCSNNRCVAIPNCGVFSGTNGTFFGTNGQIGGTAGGQTGGPPMSICGDGIRERGEICDDGNQIDDDACSNDCRRPTGEECTSPAQCESRICRDGRCVPCTLDEECPAEHRCVDGKCVVTPPFCGNGRLEPGEQCDDGNVNDGDVCSNKCLLGVGQRCTYDFQCDTGLCVNGVCSRCATDDQCPAGAACINGECLKSVDIAYTPNFCGNGILEPGEACDLGAENSDAPNAACRPDCSRGRCGDNVLDRPLEACDDGNALPGDGCNALCQVEPGGANAGATAGATAGGLATVPFQPGGAQAGQGGTRGGDLGGIVRPRPPSGGDLSDSGPATVAVMAAGAAAGYAWVRRRWRKIK